MVFSTKKLTALVLGTCLFSACQSKPSPDKSRAEDLFVEVSERVGLNFTHEPAVDGSYFMPESIGSGCAFLDYDNDSDLDIYLLNGAVHNRTSAQQILRNHLFQQESDGSFTDVTAKSGLGDAGYGMGVAVADIDNDGDVDVYVSNYGPDVLYRNNGDGTFANITDAARISNPRWGASVVFFDYNLDGFLDIYVTNYVNYDPLNACLDLSGRKDYCGPAGFEGVADLLYRNNGDGTFSDISSISGISQGHARGLGVVSADFNGDNFPDIYVANDGEANFLWINNTDGTFRDQAFLLGAALNEVGRAEAGMGIAIGDVDNDDDVDLFISHLRTESNTFYRYNGKAGFKDDSSPVGLAGQSLPYTGFGAGFLDFDHDGDLDLAVVNGRVSRGALLKQSRTDYWDDYAEPNFLFENDGTGKFKPLDTSFTRMIENSRGLAFGDVDNDGDIDLLVSNEGGRARLFLNEKKDNGTWLIVHAIDPALKRDAIGAKITISFSGKKLTRLISPGYSYFTSNDPRAHFGLGKNSSVDQIEVQWPGGSREIFPGAGANKIITLSRGRGRSE